jgi:hypothetical protein
MSASINVSNNVSIENQASKRWDEAIRDAEGELRVLTRQRMRLQQAIRIFQANKRDGVKWPSRGIIRQKQ